MSAPTNVVDFPGAREAKKALPSNVEAAVALSDIQQPEGASFRALDVPLDIVGPNDAFARKICPSVRLALLTCNKDSAEVRRIVEMIETDTLREMIESWELTAAFLGDLIAIIVCAHSRVEIVQR